MATIIGCPQCERKLRIPDELAGQDVKCPTCGATFRGGLESGGNPSPSPSIPSDQSGSIVERPSASPPQLWDKDSPQEERGGISSTRGDYYPEKRRSILDENIDDYMGQRRELARDPIANITNEYSISLSQWFRYAKENYSSVLGPMIGYIFVYAAILAAVSCIPFIGGLVRIFIDPALQAGFTIVAIAQLRGNKWTFGDFFSGFQSYGSLLGNFWLSGLIFTGALLPSIVLAIAVAVIHDSGNMDIGLALLFFLAFFMILNGFVAMYVWLRATCFNVSFIVDRRCTCIEAIQASWRLTKGHFWGILGVSMLLAAILFGPVLLLAAGIVPVLISVGPGADPASVLLMITGMYLLGGMSTLFTLPLVSLTWNAGYLLVTRQILPHETSSADDGYGEKDNYNA